MDVILKDGTTITNATPHDVIELAKNGIINADGIKRSYFNEPKDEANEFFNSLGSNEMLDACRELCKDNDKIVSEYYGNEPLVDGNSPIFNAIKGFIDTGKVIDSPIFNAIKGFIDTGKVIDSPDVDFPQVEFIGQPFSSNMPYSGYNDVTACNPECLKIYPNDTVAPPPPLSSEIDERNSW